MVSAMAVFSVRPVAVVGVAMIMNAFVVTVAVGVMGMQFS